MSSLRVACALSSKQQVILVRLTTLMLALLLLYTLISPALSTILVSAFSGLGSYLSEQALGDGVGTNLWLGNSVNAPQILGSGPRVSTNTVTVDSLIGGNATLNGTLASINGMPAVDVWFEWGYAPGALVNSTPIISTAATGAKSAAVVGLTVGATVYYRFAAGADGTSYGDVTSFLAGGAAGGGGHVLLRSLLPLLVAAGVIIAVVRGIGINLLGLAVAGILGVVIFAIVRALIDVL